MNQLHFYTGSGYATPSGIKVAIFGATANMATKIASFLVPHGVPMVFNHRNTLDVFSPQGDDVLYTRSNPYHTKPQFILNYDVIGDALGEVRAWAEIGNRYFQYCADLTNEYDIENGIKDCDVVINLIGEKRVVKNDEDYEEANIIIPREIAKMCANKKKNGNVKRFIHFSAVGASPDAISRRLRTKWQGEEEVKKYFPEATIIRPTTIIANQNATNFLGYYLHNWHNNNGTMLLVDEGKCLREPVGDLDIGLAVHNMLQMESSIGQTYELGGGHQYTFKELLEYVANILSHRPRYINMSYEDLMKLCLSPNLNFEKASNWLMARPDISAELRSDLVVKKRDGIKTFEDLYITPVSPHHILYDLCNWMLEKLAVEKQHTRDHDENDADDDGHQ